ncbi:UDP-N-acetylglucosamine 1-carboxyvinyltransferase, partial [Alkalibacillus haloalkaliphilus]|uniref:UDP-N-acetylglucosamine 1-carboxyvinyltransferase n=1 Tax=Alkalibacillus haloalkaliphilus TaxID=94136 RepID=UPI00036DFCF6
MDKIIVSGGNRLTGTVKVEGAKNAVLPVIAASIMASKGKTTLKQVPTLADVDTISEVLRYMNVNVLREGNTLHIDAANDLKTETPFEYVRKMRASVLVLGPLLARYGHAKVAMPGGCAIGSRPIDQHLKGLEAMGATIEVGNGYVEAFANGRLHGARIYLDFPSVGATENLMMAAALAEGTTVMENCAREPEIIDLANYINQMGGKVVGAGTETIRIEGVPELTGVEHTIIPDRIEAGTFMVAGAITGGDIIVDGAIPAHLRS